MRGKGVENSSPWKSTWRTPGVPAAHARSYSSTLDTERCRQSVSLTPHTCPLKPFQGSRPVSSRCSGCADRGRLVGSAGIQLPVGSPSFSRQTLGYGKSFPTCRPVASRRSGLGRRPSSTTAILRHTQFWAGWTCLSPHVPLSNAISVISAGRPSDCSGKSSIVCACVSQSRRPMKSLLWC